MIAAYLDGRVEGRERAAIEAHLAACEACYMLFSETARFGLEEEGGAKVVRPRFGRTWIALAAAACLVAAAVPIALRLRARHSVRPDVAELVAAVGPERPFEPRLTGGFRFGPMKPVYRSASPEESTSWELLAAAAKIRKQSEKEDTVQTLADLGVAQLLLGKYDDAVSSLEEANLRAPKDARILTDLSAAYLVRAKEKDRADDYPKALEAAEKATELDPKILEAWFNRAYALGELPLKSEAAKAWKDYLTRDAKSGWADEARKRLAAIEAVPNHAKEWKKAKAKMLAAAKSGDEITIRQIVPNYCQETREMIEEELLPQWAEADLGGRKGEAETELGSIRKIADAHFEASSDPADRDLVAGPLDVRVARAIVGFRDCVKAAREDNLSRSTSLCSEAQSLVSAARTPLLLRVELQLASNGASSGQGMDTRLAEVRSTAHGRGYRSFEGLASWLSGLASLQSEHYAEARDDFRKAEEDFEGTRENDHLARVEGLLASSDFYLGEAARAWAETRKMLKRIDDLDSVHQHSYLGASTLYFRDEQPRVGLEFAREDLSVPLAARDVVPRIERDLLVALAELKVGRAYAAEPRLAEASDALAGVTDPAMQSVMKAEYLALSGKAKGELNPEAGEPLLREAIAAVRKINDATLLPDVYLSLGRTDERLHRLDDATDAFRTGLKEFEGLRRKQKGEAVSYFDQAWPLVTGLVRDDLQRGASPVEALNDLEHARARDLLDRVSDSGAAEPLTVEAIQRRLRPGAALVYYASLRERLAVWIVLPGRIDFASVPVSSSRLTSLISRFLRALMSGEESGISEELFDICLRPVLKAAPPGCELAIVPDNLLAQVPFAALRNRTTKQYLVESHTISLTPSGTIFVGSSLRRPADSSHGPLRALFVGPTTGGAGQPSLPAASREIADAASMYTHAVRIGGESLSPQDFLMRASSSEVVHFAGHALVDSSHPELSRLILSGRDAACLYARDIYGVRLLSTRLVVLSACETGTGFVSRGEGVLSLARPFLAAGAPAVVASLWKVEDASTGQLILDFHRGIRDGLPPREALRRAQASMLKTSLKPTDTRAWAGFELFSAAASPS